jgi:hypothetical protein
MRILGPAATVFLVFMHVGVPPALAAGRAAQRNDEATREAGKHFQRGVTLYSETDYRGALVEFRRAYELAPNGAVLYNIGETEYQLRDYASALTTFERYLSEAAAGDGHRVEVEANVRELRTRVGRLTITTVPRGADVAIDDRALGNGFENPVVVGVGHLRVTATMAGRAPVTQYIDVAAEDDVSLLLQLPVPGAVAVSSKSTESVAPRAPGATLVNAPSSEASPRSSLRVAGWITTGVLAVGAGVFGVLALRESSDLKKARESVNDTGVNSMQYEADKVNELDHLSSRTRTYSILADSLGVAAVVVGVVTLVSGFGSSQESSAPHVSIGYRSLNLQVTF